MLFPGSWKSTKPKKSQDFRQRYLSLLLVTLHSLIVSSNTRHITTKFKTHFKILTKPFGGCSYFSHHSSLIRGVKEARKVVVWSWYIGANKVFCLAWFRFSFGLLARVSVHSIITQRGNVSTYVFLSSLVYLIFWYHG